MLGRMKYLRARVLFAKYGATSNVADLLFDSVNICIENKTLAFVPDAWRFYAEVQLQRRVFAEFETVFENVAETLRNTAVDDEFMIAINTCGANERELWEKDGCR